MKAVVAALALVLAQSVHAGEPTLDQVQNCMRANIPKTVQIKDVEVTATDRTGGSRTLRGRLYGTNEDGRLRAMMKILEPADLAGAGYLLREAKEAANDEMYVYVPALSKVRRVTGAAVDGSLWGTDLSYSDIKQVQNAFSGATAKLEGKDSIEKREVHILSFMPPKEQESHITLIRAWVDDATCVPLKVEFSEGQALSKRMTVAPADLKEADKHWYAAAALMTDLRANTNTKVRVLGVSNDSKLADRYFNPSTFYIGN
jgi:hypothetical protein